MKGLRIGDNESMLFRDHAKTVGSEKTWQKSLVCCSSWIHSPIPKHAIAVIMQCGASLSGHSRDAGYTVAGSSLHLLDLMV